MEEKTHCDDVLALASHAGRLMLECGGEIYRVEQTISHICAAYGISCCDSYATPTSIIISVTSASGRIHTVVRRISRRTTNLDRVEAVNAFSRTLQSNPVSCERGIALLREIEKRPSYSLRVHTLASAVCCGVFAILLGGALADMLCSLVVGAVLRLFVYTLGRFHFNDFFHNLMGGAAAALFSWLFTLGAGTYDIVTIASLMPLVPGMMITNAIRDMTAGELVAGISRGMEAVCIAVALACGAAAVHTIIGALGGGLL